MSRRWHEDQPDPASWQGRIGQTKQERAVEQDLAAGGRERRFVDQALASIALRVPPKSRSIYAYLRWSIKGKTREHFVCEVRENTRAENLKAAWGVAHDRGLTDSEPPQSWATHDGVRASMRGNRSRDTRPEYRLRQELFARGLRYRVNYPAIPQSRRSADVAFPSVRVAVFVDGCFWHGCPDHYRPAKTNREFWSRKVSANKSRDSETDAQLAGAGWKVLRFWEHDDPSSCADLVEATVREQRGSPTDPPVACR